MIGHVLLNTFREKNSSQAILNESGEIKKSRKSGKSAQLETFKLMLCSTLQRLKNKIIPVW